MFIDECAHQSIRSLCPGSDIGLGLDLSEEAMRTMIQVRRHFSLPCKRRRVEV